MVESRFSVGTPNTMSCWREKEGRGGEGRDRRRRGEGGGRGKEKKVEEEEEEDKEEEEKEEKEKEMVIKSFQMEEGRSTAPTPLLGQGAAAAGKVQTTSVERRGRRHGNSL